MLRSPRAAVLLAGLLAVPVLARAQSQRAPSILESYQRATALISAAVAAHGGVDALRAARQMRVTTDGWDFHRTQGRRLGTPYDSTVARNDLMIDLSRGQLVRRRVRGWPGGFHYTDWFVTDSARHFYIEPRNERYSTQNYPPADQQTGNLFLYPAWYVLAAHESAPASQRRYLGRMRMPSGTVVEVVQIPLSPSGTTLLGFDPATSQLRALPNVGTDVFTGDTELAMEITGWRKDAAGHLVPEGGVQYRSGEALNRWRYTSVTFGYAIPDSLRSPPRHFTAIPSTPPAPSVRELAPGVWTVGSGSKSLVVAFNDHVVVVDAPSNTSAEVIRTVPTLAPGKPIRFVVPTHHHDDHFMGVRYHAAAGTTIVTTSGNVDYLRRIMNAPMSTLMLPQNQVPPSSNYRSEIVSGGKRVFTDGTRSLELHQIASPHAEETLVAWLPAEGVLFQADLVESSQTGGLLRGSNAETTTHLASVIQQKGWNVRVFAGAHGTLESPSVFAELARLPILPQARFDGGGRH